MTHPPAAILILHARARSLAERIAELSGPAEIHAPACIAGRAEVAFARATIRLAELFQAGRPIVALCASGIVVRALAPHLVDKASEPPVLAVAEDGSCVVPLLGGHNGANALARRIAGALGCRAAITTASELAGDVALDDPPPGWILVDREAARPAIEAIAAGTGIALDDRTGLGAWLQPAATGARAGTPVVRLTVDRESVAAEGAVLVPRIVALGVGCERGADPAHLRALAHSVLEEAGIDPRAVAVVVSHRLKCDEPAVHSLAGDLGVPARFFAADTLLAETERLSERSPAVFAETGCWGVAEGAALAAVGPGGQLVVAKRKANGCTAALARADGVLDPAGIGTGRGRLAVVGLGPGDPSGRTPEATAELDRATDLVGYGLYLDLAGDRAHGKTLHRFDLGEEERRCRHALDLACAGRDVALVCSGDPGVFAMATLVCELLDQAQDPVARRIEIAVVPGVSAMQVAAARSGAPLGHDFAVLSLSDLLTPWPVIERRLEAAAVSDMAVALYNPVSRRRRTALPRAIQILAAHRPASTPVVVARQLGRPEEQVSVTTLAELDPETVDMLTVVLIGAATTRRLVLGDGRPLVYTPRGYRL